MRRRPLPIPGSIAFAVDVIRREQAKALVDACAAKFAVLAVTESFRQEAGPDIRSMAIDPGAAASELGDHIPDPALREEMRRACKDVPIPAVSIARAVSARRCRRQRDRHPAGRANVLCYEDKL